MISWTLGGLPAKDVTYIHRLNGAPYAEVTLNAKPPEESLALVCKAGELEAVTVLEGNAKLEQADTGWVVKLYHPAQALYKPLFLNMINASSSEILSKISQFTKVNITSPHNYPATPRFSVASDAKDALRAIGSIWIRSRPVWLAQADGSVWWGPLLDCPQQSKTFKCPAQIIQQANPALNEVKIGLAPELLCGSQISKQFSGSTSNSGWQLGLIAEVRHSLTHTTLRIEILNDEVAQ